jgi:hypothetical protein
LPSFSSSVTVAAGRADDRFDVNPVSAAVENHQFVPALGVAELGGVSARRNTNAFFANQRAARRLSNGEGA